MLTIFDRLINVNELNDNPWKKKYLLSPFRDSELELSNEATVLQSGEAR